MQASVEATQICTREDTVHYKNLMDMQQPDVVICYVCILNCTVIVAILHTNIFPCNCEVDPGNDITV